MKIGNKDIKLKDFCNSDEWRAPFIVDTDMEIMYVVDPNKSTKDIFDDLNKNVLKYHGIGVVPFANPDVPCEVVYVDQEKIINTVQFSVDGFYHHNMTLDDMYVYYTSEEEGIDGSVFTFDIEHIDPMILIALDENYAYYIPCKKEGVAEPILDTLQNNIQNQILYVEKSTRAYYLGDVSMTTTINS